MLMYQVLLQSQGCSLLFRSGADIRHLPRLVVNLEASGMSFSRLSTGRTEMKLRMFDVPPKIRTLHLPNVLDAYRLSQVAPYEMIGSISGVRGGSVIQSVALQPLRTMATFSVS